jgi:phthalate 4,5-cis-dihydrodiol dehydrogenase
MDHDLRLARGDARDHDRPLMAARPLALGVAGLGRAFTIMLPTLARHPRVKLVAAADPRPEARAQFERDFGGRAFDSVEALCADRGVDALYVATPHEHHAAHAIAALRAGKHVLVEKPMAISVAEARAMVEAARAADRRLVVGPSHSFDAPIARTRALIEGGTYGRVRMIHAVYHTDFLYRPRRPAELDTAQGGGVVFSQAAHQVDVVRLLAGGMATRVRAMTGAWDAARPTEGAYSALIAFHGGAFASLTYSGYAHYDGDEALDGIGELGQAKDPRVYGAARRALAAVHDARGEAAAKNARSYGGEGFRAASDGERWHEHFGSFVASCERADLRPTPRGVWIYADHEKRFEPLAPPSIPRTEVIDELCDAVARGASTLHRGEWGLATLEACAAILESARHGRDVELLHQVPP